MIYDPPLFNLYNPNYYQPFNWTPVVTDMMYHQTVDTVTRTREDILNDIEKLLQELKTCG